MAPQKSLLPDFKKTKEKIYDFTIIVCLFLGIALIVAGIIILVYNLICGTSIMVGSGTFADVNIVVPLPVPIFAGIGILGIGLKFGK